MMKMIRMMIKRRIKNKSSPPELLVGPLGVTVTWGLGVEVGDSVGMFSGPQLQFVLVMQRGLRQ
jgi:hypothetical protein